jgi:hypothetical protein
MLAHMLRPCAQVASVREVPGMVLRERIASGLVDATRTGPTARALLTVRVFRPSVPGMVPGLALH